MGPSLGGPVTVGSPTGTGTPTVGPDPQGAIGRPWSKGLDPGDVDHPGHTPSPNSSSSTTDTQQSLYPPTSSGRERSTPLTSAPSTSPSHSGPTLWSESVNPVSDFDGLSPYISGRFSGRGSHVRSLVSDLVLRPRNGEVSPSDPEGGEDLGLRTKERVRG